MLSSHPLFSQGVETLLRQREGFQIVGHENDADKAIEVLKQLSPDIVVLDTSAPSPDSCQVILSILNASPEIKIIGMNLENNTISIYSGEQRIVHQVQDLMQAIEND